MISACLWLPLLWAWKRSEVQKGPDHIIYYSLLERPWMIPTQYIELPRKIAADWRDRDGGSMLELFLTIVMFFVLPSALVISAWRLCVISYKKHISSNTHQRKSLLAPPDNER